MERTRQTIKQTTSTTWRKLYEIQTRAKTRAGLIKAIKEGTRGTFAGVECLTDEECAEWLDGWMTTVCKDGIIIWED